MIQVVQRLTSGPATWTPPDLDIDAFTEIPKDITLHPFIQSGPMIPTWENMAKLLPSN
jgi:hypothetical protein